MTETNIVSASIVLPHPAVGRSVSGRILDGLLLTVRWTGVLLAAILWLVVVPIVALVDEARRPPRP